MTRREHEFCMSAAYNWTTKLDTIWRFFCFSEGGGSSTDMDDGRCGLEKAKSLSWFVAILWDDEHDSYEREGQDTRGNGCIRVRSKGRTRGRGLHRRVRSD